MSDSVAPYSRMSAEVYDAIYHWKNYEQETERLVGFIQQHKTSEGNELLDVACGTAAHLQYLNNDFQVTGVDLSEYQLAEARKRLPDVTFHQGNAMSFDLDHQFDVVTCLFSSIGYLHPLEHMKAAVSNMAKHLKPGGVLLVEPWIAPDAFKPGTVHAEFSGDNDKLKVCRMNVSEVLGNISVLNMHHMVGRPSGIEYFVEKHELALYTDEEYRQAFEAAGLEVTFDQQGLMDRGLYIATKSLQAKR